MAIRLKVQTTQARLKVQDSGAVRFGAETGIPIYPSAYTRAYEVTPTQETQTLPTEGLIMSHNVVINPIPSNYGLITWNGSTLTVS